MRMMRAVVAALVAAAAGASWAGAPAWGRQMEFAKRLLRNHGYADLSQLVVDKVVADPEVKGAEKADLFRAVGEYHVEAIESIRGKNALQQCTAHLGEARTYFNKYAAEPSVTGAGRFEARKRLAWLSVNLARVYVRMLDEPDAPKADQAKQRAEAISVYRAAIKEFEALAAEKKIEEAKAKGLAKLKEDEAYLRARNDHVSVRIYLNDTRVELGRFLKTTGANVKEWQPLIQAATKDYKQMLYDFSGAAGLAQINVKFAEAIVELGPENDKEALERLDEVWEGRQGFLNHKAVPCKAMHIKAAILSRQKKYSEAVDALDEMIGKRTGGGWDPAQLKIDLVGARVTDILRNLDEGDSPQQYDTRALAESFVLMADGYAALGKAAEDAKKPGKEIERFYGMAYEIAVGVWDAKIPMDPKYARLIQLWRVKGRRPLSLTDLNIQIRDALANGDRLRDKDLEKSRAEYLKAARLYTEVVGRTKPEPEQLRKIWDSVGKCYYAAGDYYASYLVFAAMARWFLKPEPPQIVAYGYAQAAVSAIRTQCDLSVKAKASASQVNFEKDLLGEANLLAESLSPLGPEAHTIARARELRGEKDFGQALKLLAGVRPESRVYAHSLHERAVTYREMFLALPKDEQKGIAGQRLLKSCLDAFQACLDFGRKKLPELKGDEEAEERRRLLDALATSLAIYCDTLLKDFVNQPAKILELTSNLSAAYAGIDDSAYYGLILYSRMHAAYAVATGKDVARAAQALPVLEETWKQIKELPEFKYLANACKMGAMAYNELARRLEEEAKTAQAAAKADLEKRAGDARGRGLEFYLELLVLAPHQSLTTYRYVLYQLDKRVHEPKSADWRRIVEIAPKALGLFRKDEASVDELAQVRILLGSAYCGLRNWREGIAVLEQVDGTYEPDYRKRMADYDKRKAAYDQNPDPRKPAPRLPFRHPIQVQGREFLGRAYIETNARAKLRDAKLIYAEQVKSHPKRESPKYWEGMYFLCEATRMEGDLEEVTKYLYRVTMVIGENTVATGKGTVKDFLDLATKVNQDVQALTDAARKKSLLPTLDAVLKKLGKP
ncbi:MAG TPA: hypothetical protein VNE39_22060 [Planctomycetota bacterium]|nr:hypothetical protein [Planctomycetota bacterium]